MQTLTKIDELITNRAKINANLFALENELIDIELEIKKQENLLKNDANNYEHLVNKCFQFSNHSEYLYKIYTIVQDTDYSFDAKGISLNIQKNSIEMINISCDYITDNRRNMIEISEEDFEQHLAGIKIHLYITENLIKKS